MQETIIIFDFGSQYTQLIARRVRELNVYCEIHPYNHPLALAENVKGLILSGSPFSVRQPDAPTIDLSPFRGRVPILAVCYGAQFLAHLAGGEVLPSEIREYGRANLSFVDQSSDLVKNMSPGSQVWMSHGDTILSAPADFKVVASTPEVRYAGFSIEGEPTYGIQFHPEVYHSTEGMVLLKNFVAGICRCSRSWTPDSYIDTTVKELQQKLGNDKVLLGLSGGVDSSVAAVLLHKAIGNRLFCIFVDNGLLRKNEFESV
ncbi:MAG TPA: glutamine-hydrolyzing GMP synthase, partial [Bacteroidales bacterium]|nr:glutamine-hydrolyzing GMP synthase [Bacteroidales bacterium]